MRSRKSTYAILGFAIIATIAAIVFFSKNRALKSELQKVVDHEAQLERTMEYYEQMSQVDSLLVEGNYQDAIKTSEAQLQQISDGLNGAGLRIALANKMLEMNDGLRKIREKRDSLQEADSLKKEVPIPRIAKVDSLQFALEKHRVQLDRLRRQLRENSGGAYLTFTNSKGSQVHYVGEVKNGKANGHGIAILNTGSRYKGEWKDNKRHGEGTFHWPDGEYYVGHYKNDMRNGKGSYYWGNGEKFVGLWENDERAGEGVFYGKEGKVIGGVWEGDELVKAEKL